MEILEIVKLDEFLDKIFSGFGEGMLFDEFEEVKEVVVLIKDVEFFGDDVKRNVIFIEVFEEGIINYDIWFKKLEKEKLNYKEMSWFCFKDIIVIK